MLNSEQIQANKLKFIELLNKVIQINPDRNQEITQLINYLEKTDFFTAPASTKYHQAYEGGLCEHSLQVYENMQKICSMYNVTLAEDSKIIVSLLHDLCKIASYEKQTKYIPKKDANGKEILKPNGKPEWDTQIVWGYKNDAMKAGHASKSLFYISQFLHLTKEEYEAIYWHMGAYDLSNYSNVNELSSCYEVNKLAFILFQSDMFSTYLTDRSLNN